MDNWALLGQIFLITLSEVAKCGWHLPMAAQKKEMEEGRFVLFACLPSLWLTGLLTSWLPLLHSSLILRSRFGLPIWIENQGLFRSPPPPRPSLPNRDS